MSTDLTLPAEFKEVLKEKILSTFVAFIPAEKLEAMMQAEINAFFDTEKLLYVQETRVEVANPHYKPGNYGDRTNTVNALSMGAKMTPFRQLVWKTLFEHIEPIVSKMISESEGKFEEGIYQYLASTGPVVVGETAAQTVGSIAQGMSAAMFSTIAMGSIRAAHENMKMSLQQTGIDPNRIPSTPPFTFPI